MVPPLPSPVWWGCILINNEKTATTRRRWLVPSRPFDTRTPGVGGASAVGVCLRFTPRRRSVRRIKISYTTDRRNLPTLLCDARGTVIREAPRSVSQTLPLLRLRGQWLADAGFDIGDRVNVAVSNGQLIITPEGGDTI